MKALQSILAALMIFVGPSAFANGPFSNDLYSFDLGGVYTVMFVSEDGVGAGRFVQNTTDIVPRNAIAYFFYRGVTYVGWNYGEVRPELKLAVGAANLRANLVFNVENNVGITLDDQMGVVNTDAVEDRRGVCNIGWKAKVLEYGQTSRFEGKGDVVVFGDAQRTVTGDGLVKPGQRRFGGDSSTYGSSPRPDFPVEGPNRTLVDFDTHGSPDVDFDVRHRQEIRVYGSRINWVGPSQFFGGATVSTGLSIVP